MALQNNKSVRLLSILLILKVLHLVSANHQVTCMVVGCRHGGRCLRQEGSNRSWCECGREYRGKYCEEKTYKEKHTYCIEFQILGNIKDYRENRTHFEVEILKQLHEVYQGVTGNGVVKGVINSLNQRPDSILVTSTLSFTLYFDKPTDAKSLNLRGILRRQLKMGTLGRYNVTTEAYAFKQVLAGTGNGFFGSKTVIKYMTITAAALLLLLSMVFLACVWLAKRRNRVVEMKKSNSVDLVENPAQDGPQDNPYIDIVGEERPLTTKGSKAAPASITPPPQPRSRPQLKTQRLAIESTPPILHARRHSHEPLKRYPSQEAEYINSPAGPGFHMRVENEYVLGGKGYAQDTQKTPKLSPSDEVEYVNSPPTSENDYVPMTGSIKSGDSYKNKADRVEYIIMEDNGGMPRADDRRNKVNDQIYINNNNLEGNAYLELIQRECDNNFFQFPRPGSRLHTSMVESFEKTAMMKSPRSRLPASARSRSKSPPRSRPLEGSTQQGCQNDSIPEEIPGVVNLCRVDYNRGNGTPYPKHNNIKANTLPNKALKQLAKYTPGSLESGKENKKSRHTKAPSDPGVGHLWKTTGPGDAIQATPSTKRFYKQTKTPSAAPQSEKGYANPYYGPPFDEGLGIHLTPKSKRYSKKKDTTACLDKTPSFGGFGSGLVNMAFADDSIVDLSSPLYTETLPLDETDYNSIEEYTEIGDDNDDSAEEYHEIDDQDKDEEKEEMVDPRRVVLLPTRKKKKSITDELPAYFAKKKSKSFSSDDNKSNCKKLRVKSHSDDNPYYGRRKLPPIPAKNDRRSFEKS